MVTFVGAGPGDKELITVKGMKALQTADCIIYAGSLVNPELLEYSKKECKIYDSSAMTLEQVFEVMLANEQAHISTVRLHTGDPSIYGAIREQIDLLKNHNIDYEIIPGVSSFLGAAASLGVEYTLPGVSQTVILTRMEGRTAVPSSEDIKKLASAQASMVIFLSAGMLLKLQEKLIKGGYKPNTPAAIVYKATWHDEKIVKTTLQRLALSGEEAAINKTALVLVGDFLCTEKSLRNSPYADSDNKSSEAIFFGEGYDRSLLYHPDFTHGYRNGSEGNE